MTMRASPLSRVSACMQHVLLALATACGVMSAQAGEVAIRMVESDAWGVTLEMTAAEVTLHPVSGSDGQWYRLDPGDMAVSTVPGQPALPRQGVLLAIPADAGLTLTIADARYDDIAGRAILPNLPRLQQTDMPLWQMIEGSIDRDFYTRDSLLPESPVSIGFTGMLREQAVAQILFHPFQVNPAAHKLRVYRQLRVRVAFDRPLPSGDVADAGSRVVAAGGSRQGAVDPFAALFHSTLINAGQVGR